MAVFQGLVDFHSHFFSGSLLERVAAPTPGSLGGELGPGSDVPVPAEADVSVQRQRWFEQMSEHGVEHLCAYADLEGEVAPLALAAAASDDRLLPFAAIDPTAPGASDRAEELFGRDGLRGLVLTPALHGYLVDCDEARPVLELAASLGAPVVVHCGLLPPKLRDRPGAPPFDPRLASPLSLVPAADRFPRIPFVIPRFGGGFLREALMAGEACENVHVDTSSDHSWRRTQEVQLRLEDVFERALGVFGVDRILFGTGSSIVPRGWRHDLFTVQREALGALGVSGDDQARIFRDNARRLLAL